MVQDGAGWYRMVQDGAGWYRMVHGGFVELGALQNAPSHGVPNLT